MACLHDSFSDRVARFLHFPGKLPSSDHDDDPGVHDTNDELKFKQDGSCQRRIHSACHISPVSVHLIHDRSWNEKIYWFEHDYDNCFECATQYRCGCCLDIGSYLAQAPSQVSGLETGKSN